MTDFKHTATVVEGGRLDGMTRIDLSLFVAPELAEKVRELIDTPNENESITLHIEKLVGALVEGNPFSDRDFGFPDYGATVIECYPHGEA